MNDTRVLDEGRQIFVEESRDLIRSMEAALLALEDPCGGDRGKAHAVADDENDVLRAVGVPLLCQNALQLPLRLLEVGIFPLNQPGVLGL